jgi:hypothetical protein
MKQCFTHRLPSPVTLLSDPWPEDFSQARDKVERLMKTGVLPLALKSDRRKPKSGPPSA